MSRMRQNLMIIVLFLVISSYLPIRSDHSANSYSLDSVSDTGKIEVEIVSLEKSDASNNQNDFFTKNSENKSWTYMLYLDADNDIEGDAIRDFEWLEEAGGSDENISIVVLLDRIPGYDNTHGNWNGSRIYNITADVSPLTIDSQLMVDLGEVDMADPATLTDFITYCFDNFPADNYMLDLWNHGHAAYGVIDDETNMNHFIVNDVQIAINDALASYSEEIDIISMDACDMATIEVAWELRNLCSYFLASEDNTNGYPYDTIMQGLKSNPSMNASSLCELMVDKYSIYYGIFYACLSAINQTKLLDIPDVLNSFISELMITLEDGNYDDFFGFSREITREFYDGNWIDFITLLEYVIFFIDDPSLVILGEELLETLNQIVAFNWQNPLYQGKANGLTIYMPYGSSAALFTEDYIDGLGFCAGMDWQTYTLWDEFLAFYIANQLHTASIDPQILYLDEVVEDCSITQNSIDLYRVNLWQNSIYEFYCDVYSGDIDIKIVEYDFAGGYEYIGGSYLINPDDGSSELCRFRLETGFYLIIVTGKDSTSNYDIVVRTVDQVELVCNSPYTTTGGTINGNEEEHFKQYLNHYFQIAMPYGNNTITLTNSELVSYQLAIYNEFWQLLYFLPAIGLGEVLSLSYNQTSTDPVILNLVICGYEGVGEFTIEIKNPNEPTPKMACYCWQFVFIIPVLLVIIRNRYKRRKKISIY